MYYWPIVAVVVVAVCSCERERSKPIEPEPVIPEPVIPEPVIPEPVIPEPVIPEPEPAVAATPEQLMHNIARAMRDRDKALYETLLDEDFWFNETDCLGYTVFDNDLETELTIIVGSRDGSTKGLFDIFLDFSYDLELHRRWQELGSEFPETYEGDPDGHPDEDWEVFYGRVQMLMLDENGEGYRVDQFMTFKLRLDDKGLWRIVRWIDDPLAGSCGGAGKEDSWGQIKSTIFPIGSS